jgi:hypothetical protein
MSLSGAQKFRGNAARVNSTLHGQERQPTVQGLPDIRQRFRDERQFSFGARFQQGRR